MRKDLAVTIRLRNAERCGSNKVGTGNNMEEKGNIVEFTCME